MVDYLRGSTGEVELLDSPVVVDPGEETRGRVPRLLASYANNPASAKIVAEEISVMTADDQAKVRDAGRAIRDKREVDYEVFPGYVDRYALGEALADYAAETAELLDTADHLAQGGMDHEEVNRLGVVFSSAGMTVTDDVNGQITRLAEQRTHLRSQILDGQGLIAMERAQLAAVLDDIDTGRIHGPAQLPELLFADETTKADADTRRVHERSVRLATATREAITQCIDATQLVDPRGRDAENLKFATSSVGDSIYSVACGAKGMGIEYERKSYAEKRARLERTLGDAGLHLPTRMEIRELVDDRARQAGTLGQAAARREHEWKAKVDRVVSARDDAIAQRTAAAAGRAPSPAGRGCVSRPDRAAQSEVPARAAGRRPQRGQGVEL
ncbi:hypothetical protein [Nocardia sp. IFM 10818]